MILQIRRFDTERVGVTDPDAKAKVFGRKCSGRRSTLRRVQKELPKPIPGQTADDRLVERLFTMQHLPSAQLDGTVIGKVTSLASVPEFQRVLTPFL